MAAVARRFHWSEDPAYEATCADCSWKTNQRNAMGQAAQHHDRNGHTVKIKRTQVTVYETRQRYERRTGRKPEQATQGKLL
jgi:hypothetical protein